MRKTSLKMRIYLLLMAMLAAATGIIVYLTCRISYENAREMSMNTSRQLVETASAEINSLFGDMWDISRILGRDTRVQRIMRTQYEKQRDMFSDTFEVSAMLSEYNQFYPRLFCIYFFSDQGASCESKYYRITLEDLTRDALYRQACEGKVAVWAQPRKGSLYSVTTGESLITAMVPVKELSSGAYQGAIVLEMEESRVQEFLNAGIGENGFMYICDENGTPIIFPEKLDEETALQHIGQKEQLTLTQELRYCGWSVVGVVPRSDLTRSSASIIKTVLIACGLVLALAALATYGMIRRLLRPLDELNEMIGRVGSGDMTARTQVVEYNEIGTVMLRFNQMVEQVDELLKREVENQNKLRLMELTMLHEQIKPHFLYNTLDSVVWMARGGNDEGIIKMTLALTSYLKTSLNKGSDIIPLEKEIEHTASYLYIQSIRYKDRFTYDIVVDPSLHGRIVPKLIVQPLVENAIYHGIKRKREPSHVTIRAWEENGLLHIDIADNGAGMTDERAEELRTALRSRDATERVGFGVRNVNERIRIMYGEAYTLTFESEEGMGTTFHIVIPEKEGG